MTGQRWERITVIGCGLIGASFALAMKRSGACAVLDGWDKSSAVLDAALECGVIDDVDQSFARGDVSSSDLIYLAMPVEEIIMFLRDHGRQFKTGAIVTDAGSTKTEICHTALHCLPEECLFIGGHPVAGSHFRGLAHATPDLFSGAPYVLIAGRDQIPREPALGALKETLELLGTRVTFMTADEHDRAMALVSHLPQIVSGVMAAVVRGDPDAAALTNVSGAGFRDMTRLAESSWSVWRSILKTNPTHIVATLEMLIEKLTTVRDELKGCREEGGDDLKMTRKLFVES